MAEKLRYDVEVNTRDGVRELDRLGKAGKEAGQEIESGFEGAESATDQVVAAIRTMSNLIDTEMRDTAAAADALRLALGETADRVDASEAVAEFKRMGLSADQVRADVDKLAAALREADDLDMKRMGDGIDTAGTSLGKMRGEADQSRSVLANMAGNATQDLGALGGVAGTAGVAIGQLAEYATEGNISVGNLAKVAGPMLGLAAATQLVSTALGGLNAEKAFKKQLVEDFTDALRDGATIAESLKQQIQETGELNFETGIFGGGGILGLGSKTKDLIEIFNGLGVSFDQFTSMVEDTTAPERLEELEIAAFEAGEIELGVMYRDAADGLRTYQESADLAAQAQQGLNQFLGPAGSSFNTVNKALTDLNATTATTAANWETLLTDLRDGKLDTLNALNAFNALKAELDLDEEAMAALVDQKLGEKFEADAAAAEELAAELRDARLAAAEYDAIISGTDWGNAGLEATATVLSGYVDSMFAAGDAAAANEEAYDGLAESLKAAGESGLSFNQALLDVDSPEGRAVRQSMRQLADSLIPDIQKAYDDADGDQQKFYDNMAAVGSSTLAEMQRDLGLTTDEVNFLAQQIGLTPEMVRTTFELIGEEEAKLQLGLMQGLMDTLTEPQQAEISMLILEGDYVGARNKMQTYLTRNPATIYVEADVTAAMRTINNLLAAIRGARAVASVALAAGTQAVGTSAAPAAMPMMGMADVAPVNVYVNAPRGTRPEDLVRAGDRYARRNGRSRASR